MLVRSAHSANIKERRDASTALFDARGRMVMQAEHIPVHLGAMPSAVAAVLDEDHEPGDAWILNDPYRGGTHLPDITVIAPLFHGKAGADRVRGSRAHHADVGAREPGSMPADSRTLEDEGVVIPPTRLDERHPARARRPGCATRASARPTCAPSSPPGAPGAERVEALIERFGLDSFRAGLEETLDYAERRTRARIAELAGRRARARATCSRPPTATSSCGSRRRVEGDELELDFSGSADAARRQPQLPARRDAVRLLLRPARAHRPRRAALRGRLPPAHGASPPRAPCSTRGRRRPWRPATSRPRRGWPTSCWPRSGSALGQGTMNNLTLGNDDFTYYETLGGGQGACAGRRRPERRARGDVEHAQHARSRRSSWSSRCGPSSTRCAAARAARAPPRRRRRGARAGGARRDALLADHRAPPSLRRRAPMVASRARGVGTSSTARSCRAKASGTLHPGDRLRIETPGGGGHGRTLTWSGRAGRLRSAWGSWAGRWRATCARPGFELAVCTRTARRPSASPPSTARARPPPPPRPPRARTPSSRWSPDAPEVEAGAARRPRRRRRAARGRAGRRHVHDRPHRRPARSASGCATARLRRGAGHRARKPKAEDGTLTIFAGGERRGVRARPAAVRRDGRADRARGPAGPRPDGQAAHQHDGRGQRRRAGRGGAHGQGGRARRGRASSRWPPEARARARCSTSRGGPMFEETSSRCCSSSSTCSRTCATRSPRHRRSASS